jgi:hypothetical protein
MQAWFEEKDGTVPHRGVTQKSNGGGARPCIDLAVGQLLSLLAAIGQKPERDAIAVERCSLSRQFNNGAKVGNHPATLPVNASPRAPCKEQEIFCWPLKIPARLSDGPRCIKPRERHPDSEEVASRADCEMRLKSFAVKVSLQVADSCRLRLTPPCQRRQRRTRLCKERRSEIRIREQSIARLVAAIREALAGERVVRAVLFDDAARLRGVEQVRRLVDTDAQRMSNSASVNGWAHLRDRRMTAPSHSLRRRPFSASLAAYRLWHAAN